MPLIQGKSLPNGLRVMCWVFFVPALFVGLSIVAAGCVGSDREESTAEPPESSQAAQNTSQAKFVEETKAEGEPVEFTLLDGSGALEPRYAWETKMVGSFGRDGSVAIVYETKAGEESMVENSAWSGTLEGEAYERFRRTVLTTSLEEPKFLVGGGVFSVTLEDARGNTVTGEPENADEWRQLEQEIENLASTAGGGRQYSEEQYAREQY